MGLSSTGRQWISTALDDRLSPVTRIQGRLRDSSILVYGFDGQWCSSFISGRAVHSNRRGGTLLSIGWGVLWAGREVMGRLSMGV